MIPLHHGRSAPERIDEFLVAVEKTTVYINYQVFD